jgi:hypothetical protein
MFAAALVQGRAPAEALELAVGAVAEAVEATADAGELPIAALPTALSPSPRVTLRRIDG